MKKRIIGVLLCVALISSVLYFKKMREVMEESNNEENEQLLDGAIALADTDQTTTGSKTMVQIGSKDTKLYKEASQNSKIVSEVTRGELITLLSEEEQWYYVQTNDGDTGYISKKMSELVQKTVNSTPTSLSEATIVLNPGHGGDDTGAISNSESIYEKNVTLSTAKAIKEALEAEGCTVIMTRENDSTEDLGEVVDISNENEADVFISLHYDSSENENEATGTTTYYYYQEYSDLAETINESLTETLSLKNRGIEYGNFQVLRENMQPSVLLELGYMNTDSDLATFNTKSYQKAVAKAIVSGLTEYFQAN